MDEKKLEQIKRDHQVHKELTSVLANERTYAAWVRTGLTAMATGLAVAKLLHGVIPENLIPIIALVLLFCSLSFFILATWRYIHVGSSMTTESIAGASTKNLLFLTILLGLTAIAAAIGIIVVSY